MRHVSVKKRYAVSTLSNMDLRLIGFLVKCKSMVALTMPRHSWDIRRRGASVAEGVFQLCFEQVRLYIYADGEGTSCLFYDSGVLDPSVASLE